MRKNALLAQTLVVSALLFVAGCERPPIEATQNGFRGTAMVDIQNPRDPVLDDAFPASLPPMPAAGPRAGDTYQNVQVLGDLSVAQFTRLMTAMTAWVSPDGGCNYCHDPANLASDDIYTKVVSRRMIQMTQRINGDWSNHVAETGVNCYTCHRGNPVPEYIWFSTLDPSMSMATYSGNRAGQNIAAPEVGFTSLPRDPFTQYLTAKDADAARIIPAGMHPGAAPGATIQETEAAYALMMHFSGALDVNCTYCHNSASFQSWEQSTPTRITAYHGLQMVRDLNMDYLIPLGPEYPAERLGPEGDAPKVNCLTCHQGQSKPLGGAAAITDYPSLRE